MVARAHASLRTITIVALFFALGASVTRGAPSPALIKFSVFRASGVQRQLAFAGVATGKVIHTADGGQIFGFDIDQNGSDGFLGSAQTITAGGQVLASLETFDQTTARITKTVVTTKTMDDWVAEGIFFGDVGLVLHDHVVGLTDTRLYRLMNPVTSNAFTGNWTPPGGSSFIIQQAATNQATRQTAVLGQIGGGGNPIVFGSNIAANTFGKVVTLDSNVFSQAQLALDTKTNEAILATSPDGGAVGGAVPLIAKVNLTTGAIKEFNGIRIGIFHSGFVNGLAVDSATGMACTTTELDAAVEFYNLTNDTGVFVAPLPGSDGNQGVRGETVVNDPIHRLFLVAQPAASIGPPGSAIIVFDEQGNLVEAITGFAAFSVTPGLAINPSKRLGYIQGPTPDALLQFSY